MTSSPPPHVDLYGPVHRGLRLALTTVLTRIGATDTSDCTRLATMRITSTRSPSCAPFCSHSV